MSEDNAWVFDSLVCFLHGPIWNAPLQTFVEEKSLIFDPSGPGDCTNPEYVRTHDEYKRLVDFMLGSFMDEMQITPAQFEVACLEGRQTGAVGNAFSFHQGLFQQIWAANDIRIFVRMMTQRNVELQLQALDLIEHRQQNLTDADRASGVLDVMPDQLGKVDVGGADVNGERDEDKMASASSSPDRQLFETIEMQLRKEQQLDPDAITSAEGAENDAVATGGNPDVVEDKFKRLNLFFAKEKIASADVQQRQRYLREQRDKIIAAKKKVRAHQLSDVVRKTSHTASGRPSSAHAAQSLLANGVRSHPAISQSDDDQASADAASLDRQMEASMQLRRTLAQRLRTEVVDEPAHQ